MGVFTITRDGVNVGNATYGLQIVANSTDDNTPATMTFVDTPTAGAHTYKVQVRAGDNGVTIELGQGGTTEQLAAVEVR